MVPAVPQDDLHAAGLGAVEEMPVGHHPGGRADLPRARHDAARPRHADRSRRDGRGRRDRARGDHSKDFSTHGPQDPDRRRRRRGHRRHHRHLLPQGLPFKLAFAVAYFAVVWVCLEAVRIPDCAPDQAGLRNDHAPHRDGGVHPDRLDLLLDRVPGRRRRAVARAPADVAARRRLGLPDLRQPVHLLHRVLPRFLRDRLHHRAAARADRAEAADAGRRRGRGADLVRRDAVRQHADLVHASAVRLRAVLPARRGAQGGQELGHLLGRDPWVGLQLIMVALVIAFPWTVTALLDKPISAEDISKVRIEIPQMEELPPIDFNTMQKSR